MMDMNDVLNRIDIHKHEHARVRFHTGRGILEVSLDEFDEGEVLRVSTGNGTITILPQAANVALVQIHDPHRDAAIIAGIVERNKERETVSMAFSDMPPGV